jgi:hypothetical protein
MGTKFRVLSMIALLSLLTSPLARAGDLVVGNLGQPPLTFDSIIPNDPSIGQPGFAAAQEFTTGSTGTSLDRIFASIGDYNAGKSNDFQLAATLYANVSGLPGGPALTTFSFKLASIPTAGFANVEFDPITPFNFAANTGYWFVLNGSSSDGSGSTDWQFTASTATYGPGTLPFFSNSVDGAATWKGPFPEVGFPNEPYLIQVNGPVVPEPSSWILGCVGFSSLWLVVRRARKLRQIP